MNVIVPHPALRGSHGGHEQPSRRNAAANRRCIFAMAEIVAEEPVARVQREVDSAEAGEGAVDEGLAQRIAHEQRAGERGGGDGGAEHHTEVRSRVKTQAALNEGPTGHAPDAMLRAWETRLRSWIFSGDKSRAFIGSPPAVGACRLSTRAPGPCRRRGRARGSR